MIPKLFRFDLRLEKDFFKRSKRAQAAGITARYLPADQLQFACVVPKHVGRTSVKRHQIKRRILNESYKLRGSFPTSKIAVVVHTPDWATISGQELIGRLTELATKLRL